MMLLASLFPDAGSVLGWTAVGLVPGFLAARVYRGGRLGPFGDTAVGGAGVAAAVVGGAITSSLGPAPAVGSPLMGTLAAAALAATAVVLAVRWFGPQPQRQLVRSGRAAEEYRNRGPTPPPGGWPTPPTGGWPTPPPGDWPTPLLPGVAAGPGQPPPRRAPVADRGSGLDLFK
ncbi:MAG TPA: hypothetical protein VH092_05810 [Urbifossiella sp.]|jgi:uncharacterized membrane protein YeaQ/YmgE (transglycosylase-associated protein family)|nr:hypothetical protein [Urbifossiella sp.]